MVTNENALQVLQGLDDVEEHLGIMSRLLAERKKKTAKIEAKIAGLTAEKDEETVEIDFLIRTEELLITQYVERNMSQFRDGSKKSRKFVTGKIETRDVENYDYPEDIVALIEEHGLSDLLQVNKVPQKALIKAMIKKDPGIVSKLNIGIENDIAIKIKPN